MAPILPPIGHDLLGRRAPDRLATLRDPGVKSLLNVRDIQLCSYAQVFGCRMPNFRSMFKAAPPAPLKTALLTLAIAIAVALAVVGSPSQI